MPSISNKPTNLFSQLCSVALKAPGKNLNFALASNLILLNLLSFSQNKLVITTQSKRPHSLAYAVGFFLRNEAKKMGESIKNPPFPPACPW